jgi:predicted RNA binding protein YcfA (HicA-like mRNA interferase family)
VSELPRLSGEETIRIFKILGFYQARQKGSHVVLRRDDKGRVIPRHKELAIGTLRSALRQAGISTEEFIKAMKGELLRFFWLPCATWELPA